MSAKHRRARRRRNAEATQIDEFNRARHDPQEFMRVLNRLANGPTLVWAVAEAAARTWPLTDDERAVICQTIAPRLAGMTSGAVQKRHVAVPPK